MKLAAIIIFIFAYILLLTFPKRRHWISLGVAILFLALQISPLKASITSTSSWNVILMLIGTMGVVGFFIESKMPNYLADVLIQKMPNVKWAIISLALFAGIISAFIDNVATVIMVAPVAMTIAKKTKNISCIKHHCNFNLSKLTRSCYISWRYYFYFISKSSKSYFL